MNEAPADPAQLLGMRGACVDTGVFGGRLGQLEQCMSSAAFTKEEQAKWWLMVHSDFYFLL